MLKNYKCPRLVTPSFNAETLLEPFRHFWKIQNCSELLKIERAANPAIFSDTFKSSFDDKFSLTLWPKGHRKGARAVEEMSVHLTNDELEHLARVQWRICFCTQQNTLLFTYAANNIIGANHLSAALLGHNFIVNAQGEPILPEDTLNIYIEVSMKLINLYSVLYLFYFRVT